MDKWLLVETYFIQKKQIGCVVKRDLILSWITKLSILMLSKKINVSEQKSGS